MTIQEIEQKRNRLITEPIQADKLACLQNEVIIDILIERLREAKLTNVYLKQIMSNV